MFSKSLAIGAIAAGCVAAAAGGAYLTARHNTTPVQQPVAAVPLNAAQSSELPKAVAETEAVVAPPTVAAVKPDVASAPVSAPKASAQTPAASAEKSARRASQGGAVEARPKATTAAARAPEPVRAEPPAAPAREVRETAAEAPPVVTPAAPVRPAAEVAPQPEPAAPPPPQREQLVVPESSVIGLRVETSLTSERARLEDRVEAKVTRDVMSEARVAIPAGAQAIGTVTLVERGGKLKDRARLGVRFHTLVLADGSELPINTEAIYREGDSPSAESTRKIGGAAVGGAILGAIIGGKKGAMVGGATGAAGGTAVVMAGDRNAATLPSGTTVTIRLAAPVGVEVEKR